MPQTKNYQLHGEVTSMTATPDVVIFSFYEYRTKQALALAVDQARYHDLFPAGEPELGVEMVAIVTETNGEYAILDSLYDPNGDMIAVDEVPELLNLATNTGVSDSVLAKWATHQTHTLAEINQDANQLRDLEQDYHLEQAEKDPVVYYENHGDPVTDIRGRQND